MLSVILPKVVMLGVNYAECHCVQCHKDEFPHAGCNIILNGPLLSVVILNAVVLC